MTDQEMDDADAEDFRNGHLPSWLAAHEERLDDSSSRPKKSDDVYDSGDEE